RLALFCGRGDDGDIASPGRILDGVVQQVQQRLLQAAAITADHQARLDTDPHRIATLINGKEIDHVLDEFGQVELLEVIAELVVLDAVDGGEVLHDVGQA